MLSGLPPVFYGTQEASIRGIEDNIDLQKRKIDLLGTMRPSEVPPAMREHEDRILEKLYRDYRGSRLAVGKVLML